MGIIEIHRKLSGMKKFQIEEICYKMRYPKGSKKDMISKLLRPLRMKYRMDEIPLDLTKEIFEFTDRPTTGSFGTVDRHTANASKKALERVRFHATDKTLKGAVRKYLDDKTSAINEYGDISGWDVSKVTNMRALFKYSKFSGDISRWNVSNVRDMSGMFEGAKFFNGDISRWDVSNVTNMENMFYNATVFGSPDGWCLTWEIPASTNVSDMFTGSQGSICSDGGALGGEAPRFAPQTKSDLHDAVFLWCEDALSAGAYYGDINTWDVSAITNMSGLFKQCIYPRFNDDISNWDVSSVTDMTDMFYGCSAFNQDISNWDVSSVIHMTDMFYGCSAFNQDIGGWNVSSSTTFGSMFQDASSFNCNLDAWSPSYP